MESFQIELPTHDQDIFGQFITQILDHEYTLDEQKLSFSIGGQSFLVSEHAKNENHLNSVAFKFDITLDELEDLKKKVEFFSYRFNDAQFTFFTDENQLCVTDDAGRRWLFVVSTKNLHS